MRYKHIIWDWNGTIVDDSWLSIEVLNSILRDFNLPEISPDFYRDNFSFPVVNFYRQIGFNLSKEAFEQIGETFISRFNAKRFDCKLQSGARELAEIFSAKGLKQSILSAYRKDFLKEAADFFDMSKYMSDIVGLSDIYANTKLALGLDYIKTLELPGREILYIGDTDHDFEVASAMGVECRLVSRGHQSQGRLQKTGAKTYADFDALKSDLLKES